MDVTAMLAPFIYKIITMILLVTAGVLHYVYLCHHAKSEKQPPETDKNG